MSPNFLVSLDHFDKDIHECSMPNVQIEACHLNGSSIRASRVTTKRKGALLFNNNNRDIRSRATHHVR